MAGLLYFAISIPVIKFQLLNVVLPRHALGGRRGLFFLVFNGAILGLVLSHIVLISILCLDLLASRGASSSAVGSALPWRSIALAPLPVVTLYWAAYARQWFWRPAELIPLDVARPLRTSAPGHRLRLDPEAYAAPKDGVALAAPSDGSS